MQNAKLSAKCKAQSAKRWGSFASEHFNSVANIYYFFFIIHSLKIVKE